MLLNAFVDIFATVRQSVGLKGLSNPCVWNNCFLWEFHETDSIRVCCYFYFILCIS